jgi:hypothetical protein
MWKDTSVAGELAASVLRVKLCYQVMIFWTVTQNEGIHDLRWAEHVARMGAMRSAYKIFVGKPDGMR